MNVEEYRHQVGGHCKLIKPKDSSKVYKPLIENEYIFYEKLTNFRSSSAESGPLHILKKFIPKFYGVTEIIIESYSDFEDKKFCSYTNNIKNNKEKKNKYKKYIKLNIEEDEEKLKEMMNKDNIENLEHTKSENYQWLEKNKSEDNNKKKESDINKEVVNDEKIVEKNNEFSKKSENAHNTDHIKKNDNLYKKVRKRKECVPHIVLEDLVYGFKRPCVLDIKMGKRQRKIGASLEKKKRQVEKSFKTTSHSLGFRLCGCQNYNKLSDTLFYKDKYWGRKLSKEKIPWAIRNWFWNGCLLYEELIPLLLEKLHSFFNCIVELRHYRFWSSSLLWVFDGGLNDKKARSNSLDIRMIDFANTIYLQDNPSPDDEYIFGLKNLIDSIQILNNSIHNIYFLPYEITTCFYSDNYNTKGIWENKIFKKSKSVIFEEKKKKNKKTVYINFEFLKNIKKKKKKKKKNKNEIQNMCNSDYVIVEDLNKSSQNRKKKNEIQITSNSDHPIGEEINMYLHNRNECDSLDFKSFMNTYNKENISNFISNDLNSTKIQSSDKNYIMLMQCKNNKTKNNTNILIDSQMYDETNYLSHEILKDSIRPILDDDKNMDNLNNRSNDKSNIEMRGQISKNINKYHKNEHIEVKEKDNKKGKSIKNEKGKNYIEHTSKNNETKSSNSFIQNSGINSYIECRDQDLDTYILRTMKKKVEEEINVNINKNINSMNSLKHNKEIEIEYIDTNKKYLNNVSLLKDHDKKRSMSTLLLKNNNKNNSIYLKHNKSDDKIIEEAIVKTLKIAAKLKKHNEKIEIDSDAIENSENTVHIKKYKEDYPDNNTIPISTTNTTNVASTIAITSINNNITNCDDNNSSKTDLLNDKFKHKNFVNQVINKEDAIYCKNNENKKYSFENEKSFNFAKGKNIRNKKNGEKMKENNRNGSDFVPFKSIKYKKHNDDKLMGNLLNNNIKNESSLNYITKNNDLKKKMMHLGILNKNINLKVLTNQIIKMEIEKRKKDDNHVLVKNRRKMNFKNIYMNNFSDSNKDVIEIQNKIKKMKIKRSVLYKSVNNMQKEHIFKNSRYFLKYLDYNSDSILVSKSIENYGKKKKIKKSNNIYKRCSSCTDILLSIKKGKKIKNKKNKIRKLFLRKLNMFSNPKCNIKINKIKSSINSVNNKLDILQINKNLRNNVFHNFSDEFNIFNSEYKNNFYFNNITCEKGNESNKTKYFINELKSKNLIVPLTETNENYKYLRRSLSEPNFYKFNRFRCINNDFYNKKIDYNNLIQNRLDKLTKVPIYNQIYGFTSNSSNINSSDYSFEN